jgi:hypothetical protein
MNATDLSGLATFLVEAYATVTTRDDPAGSIARAQQTAGEMRADGEPLEYLGALFVPGDEVIFHVIAAHDIGVVRGFCARSAITSERIVESILIDGGPPGPSTPPRSPVLRLPRVRA